MVPDSVPYYESSSALGMYAEFHYGPAYLGVPNFHQTIVTLILESAPPMRFERALDLGCGMGRASLELTRTFDHVDAVDLSVSFIQAASRMLRRRLLEYEIQIEGEIKRQMRFELDSLRLGGGESRVDFRVGDACSLGNEYRDYDLVVAINLLDRLERPRKFVAEVSGRLKRGGILAVASPYTWLQEFTPRQEWLGGVYIEGRELYTKDVLTSVLTPAFSLVANPMDVPFVIRETQRKFQHTVSELSLWKRL